MALDNLPSSLYVAFQGLETYFVDKDTGFPLSGGYVEFFVDVNRSVPKDVYQQVRLPDNSYQFVNIGHVVNLTAVGTFESPSDGSDIQVYAFPYEGTEDAPGDIELYYLEIFSSGNVLQFIREAQPANVEGSQDIDNFGESDNIIENPQFVKTFLPPSNTLTISVTGVNVENEIAPDWSIITSGTGSVTISLEDLNDILEPTGAPFALRLTSTGIDSLILRQTITQSPRIIGHGYVSASLVAKSFMSNAVPIMMNYTASNGYSVQILNQNTSASGNYTELINSSATLIDTTNTDSGSTGSVNIDIIIPAGQDIAVTSVQLVSVQNASSIVDFIQISTPRQIDHLFHYYKPQLEFKPIPSYLVGWDFPLNPAQFATTASTRAVPATAIGANKSKYVWDQTIVFQSANSGVGVTSGNSNELVLTAAATTQMAIVQYLPTTIARELLNGRMAVNIAAKASVATSATVSLWYTTNASLPNILTNDSLITTLGATGVPTVVGGWTQVPRALGNATFTIGTNATAANFNDYNFNGWDIGGNNAANTATFFAIVIGTASVTAAGTVNIYSVGLQKGDIGTRPAPQTKDDVLRECEFYYEKTYSTVSDIGSAIAGGAHAFEMLGITSGGNGAWVARQFDIRFNCEKNLLTATTIPLITFYSVAGTINNVSGYLLSNGAAVAGPTNIAITNWSTNNAYNNSSPKGVSYQPVNTTHQMLTGGALTNPEGIILAQFTIDSRLGT